MTPIQLPHPTDPAWGRAKEIVAALRKRGERNPFIVAAVVDAFGAVERRVAIAGQIEVWLNGLAP